MKDRNVIVLGCGIIGTRVARKLASKRTASRLVLADIQVDKAQKLAKEISELGIEVSATQLDVADTRALTKILQDADVVANFTLPLEKTALPVVKAAINAKVNYIDAGCADASSVVGLMKLEKSAKQSGVTILTCMGLGPGLTNILAKYGSDRLDEVDEIHMTYISTGLVNATPDIMPFFIDYIFLYTYGKSAIIYQSGHYKKIPVATERETIYFPGVSCSFEAFSASHPEVYTIPRFIKGVKLVTYKAAYGALISQIIGMLHNHPIMTNNIAIENKGIELDWVDLAVAYTKLGLMQKDQKKEPLIRGSWAKVRGRVKGRQAQYAYTCEDMKENLLETIAELGIEMLLMNKLNYFGVLTPEGIDPEPFIQAAIKQGAVINETAEHVL